MFWSSLLALRKKFATKQKLSWNKKGFQEENKHQLWQCLRKHVETWDPTDRKFEARTENMAAGTKLSLAKEHCWTEVIQDMGKVWVSKK